jgi:hypothetical protein
MDSSGSSLAGNKNMKTHLTPSLKPMTKRGVLSVLLALWSIAAANAATLTVTNTDDSGPGSLRDTIAAAAPGDTIDFSVTGTIILASELSVTKSLTIAGPGAANLSLDGNDLVRVLKVQGADLNVTISALTITRGRNTTDRRGGGISREGGGTLTIEDCMINQNVVPTDPGSSRKEEEFRTTATAH